MKAKYGVPYRIFTGIERIVRRLKESPRVALWIHPTADVPDFLATP